jgi:uncharacterized protein (TIGR03083 family)
MIVTTKPALLAAVEKSAFRLSLLLRAATKPKKKAIGTWTVAETAAHVAHSYLGFLDGLQGALTTDIDEIDAHNARFLAEDPERDLEVLADRVEAGAREYAQFAGSLAGDQPIDFFGGMRVPASSITATLLGEALVHGYDIARAEGLPWAIEPAHAAMTIQGLVPLVPHFVDEEAAAGLDAAFEIRMRDGARTYWYFDQGRLTIEDSPSRPIECHISVEPVTFLLMSYNRIGPAVPALSGKVLVWGRRPWLATRLGGIFKT